MIEQAVKLPFSSTGTDFTIWLPTNTSAAIPMKNTITRRAPMIRQALRQPLLPPCWGGTAWGFQPGGAPPPAGA